MSIRCFLVKQAESLSTMASRVFSSAFKASVTFGGISLAGTAIALSDKELHKKPVWYQESVTALENALKRVGKYRAIESITALDSAYDVLQRVDDCNNAEVSWRLARILVEKANLVADHHQKAELIHKALEHFNRAFAYEPSKGIAGAHKWYALALIKLKEVDKKHKLVPKADTIIVDHFQQACELDPKDPFAWHFLGVHYFEKKKYADANKCFQMAEEVKPSFSVANSFFIGEALHKLGHSEEAKNWLQKAVALPILSDADGKARIKAKEVLSTAFKQQELPNKNDF